MPSTLPEWIPTRDADGVNLPTPAGYRQTVPAFPSTEPSLTTRLFDRRRRILWFALAVALHAALFLGIWLSPPLRLLAGYAPDRWVQVVSIPPQPPQAPVLPAAKEVQPVAAKTKSRPTIPVGVNSVKPASE